MKSDIKDKIIIKIVWTLQEVSIQFGWEALSGIIAILQHDGILPNA